MPRPCPEGACRGCHYDLAGLGYPVRVCPECGRDAEGVRRVVHRPSGLPREDLRAADAGVAVLVSASDRAAGRADEQDEPRDDAEKDPSDAGELGGLEGFDGGDASRIGARSNKFILSRQPRD
jgi:hypothetical protein